MRRQQDRIVPRGIELAISAIDKPRFRKSRTALGLEVPDTQFVLLGHRGGSRLGSENPSGLRNCDERKEDAHVGFVQSLQSTSIG